MLLSITIYQLGHSVILVEKESCYQSLSHVVWKYKALKITGKY